MNQGIEPESFSFASEPTAIVQAQEDAFKQSDAAIADLAEHPGWTLIKEDWERRISDYRTLAGYNVAAMSKEEIGEVWLLGKHVADEMQKELDRVRATYERFGDKS
jgi:hypothetical protein